MISFRLFLRLCQLLLATLSSYRLITFPITDSSSPIESLLEELTVYAVMFFAVIGIFIIVRLSSSPHLMPCSSRRLSLTLIQRFIYCMLALCGVCWLLGAKISHQFCVFVFALYATFSYTECLLIPQSSNDLSIVSLQSLCDGHSFADHKIPQTITPVLFSTLLAFLSCYFLALDHDGRMQIFPITQICALHLGLVISWIYDIFAIPT